MRNAYKILVGRPERGGYNSEYRGVDGKIILERTLGK
jgi:hypothetical protein